MSDETNVTVTTAGLLDLAREAWHERQRDIAKADAEQKAAESRALVERRNEAARRIAGDLARLGLDVTIPPDEMISSDTDWLWPITPRLALVHQQRVLAGKAIHGPGEYTPLGWIYSLADLGEMIERVESAVQVGTAVEESEDEATWRAAWQARRPRVLPYTRIAAAKGRGILLVPDGLQLQLYVWGLKGDVAARFRLEQREVQDLLTVLLHGGKCQLGGNAFAVCEFLWMHVFSDEGEATGHAVKLKFEDEAHGLLRDALLAWLDYVDYCVAWSQERYDSSAAQPAQVDLGELPF